MPLVCEQLKAVTTDGTISDRSFTNEAPDFMWCLLLLLLLFFFCDCCGYMILLAPADDCRQLVFGMDKQSTKTWCKRQSLRMM